MFVIDIFLLLPFLFAGLALGAAADEAVRPKNVKRSMPLSRPPSRAGGGPVKTGPPFWFYFRVASLRLEACQFIMRPIADLFDPMGVGQQGAGQRRSESNFVSVPFRGCQLVQRCGLRSFAHESAAEVRVSRRADADGWRACQTFSPSRRSSDRHHRRFPKLRLPEAALRGASTAYPTPAIDEGQQPIGFISSVWWQGGLY